MESIPAGGGSLPDVVPVVWGNMCVIPAGFCNSRMVIACDSSDLAVSSSDMITFYDNVFGGYDLFGGTSIFRNSLAFKRDFFDNKTQIKFINGKVYDFTIMTVETPSLTVVKNDGSKTTYTNKTILDLYEQNGHNPFTIPAGTDLIFENMDFSNILLLRIDTYALVIND